MVSSYNHKSLSYIELAEFLTKQDAGERFSIFESLPHTMAIQTFEYLPFHLQKEILYSLPSDKAAKLLNDLSPDDRTGFFEELPSQVVNGLIKLLSPEERMTTLKILGYPEDSVGRLMTPDYLTVKMHWTVKHALDYIRKYGHDSETINVLYIVDKKGVLIDDLKIKELLFSPLQKQIRDICDHKVISINALEKQENAIHLFKKYNRVALPIVDNDGVLLGIVTIDDVLQVMEEQDTEDIQRMGGIQALEEPYLDISFFELIKKRVGWLTILFLGELLTASAMGHFEEEISKAVVLALFIPLIISSGGNSGSQATTLIIRSLALTEIKLSDWWRIMKRELLAGLVLGSVLGAIGFFRVVLWSAFSSLYGEHWFLIAVTIFFSLIGVVCLGTLSGSMIPFILKSLKLDPATCSAPFVATLVDVTGILIYFTIALLILRGTLL